MSKILEKLCIEINKRMEINKEPIFSEKADKILI